MNTIRIVFNDMVDKGELYSWGANIGQFLYNEPNSITTEPRSVHLFPDTQKQINKLYVGHNHAIFVSGMFHLLRKKILTGCATEGEYFGVGKNDHGQLLFDDLSLRNAPHKIAFLNALDAKKIVAFESNTFVLTSTELLCDRCIYTYYSYSGRRDLRVRCK